MTADSIRQLARKEQIDFNYNPFARRRLINDEQHEGNTAGDLESDPTSVLQAGGDQNDKSEADIVADRLDNGPCGSTNDNDKHEDLTTDKKLVVAGLLEPPMELTPRKLTPMETMLISTRTPSICSFSASSSTKVKKHLKYRRVPYRHQIAAIFLASWSNIMLAFVPAGFAVYYTRRNAVTVFVVNFLATVPSNSILGFAIDECGMHVGSTATNLLSISFGNAAQLITSILLLKTRQIAVLEASLLGTILQSLLLMTGLCFLVGGCRHQQQYFHAELARTIAMFLLLAVLSLVIPTAAFLVGNSTPSGVLALSRGTAVTIMLSYVLYLVFQLGTNKIVYTNILKTRKPADRWPANSKSSGETKKSFAWMGAISAFGVQEGKQRFLDLEADKDEEEDPEPVLSKTTVGVTIVACTTLLAFNVQFATDGLQILMTQHHVSTTFMGTVVLPLLGNDINALKTAFNDKMDVSIALTLERCMQTALMVVPLVIFVAWGMGIDDFSLQFNSFSVVGVFAAIIIVTYVVQEGKSNWLTGALLIKAFIILGLASYVTE